MVDEKDVKITHRSCHYLSKFLTAALPAALAVLQSCSSATLTLQSAPAKADIYAAKLSGGAPKLIGQTPLTISASDLEKQVGGSGPVSLEYRKNGYQPAKTLVTDIGAVDLTLNLDLPIATGLEEQEKMNAVIDRMFEAQRLARVGRPDDALKKLKDLEKDAPQIAAIYELEGGIYFLKKQYKEAFDAYGLAAKYNPTNPVSSHMRSKLETTLGVKRVPASDKAPAKEKKK